MMLDLRGYSLGTRQHQRFGGIDTLPDEMRQLICWLDSSVQSAGRADQYQPLGSVMNVS
jgi:hypothetical protein